MCTIGYNYKFIVSIESKISGQGHLQANLLAGFAGALTGVAAFPTTFNSFAICFAASESRFALITLTALICLFPDSFNPFDFCGHNDYREDDQNESKHSEEIVCVHVNL